MMAKKGQFEFKVLYSGELKEVKGYQHKTNDRVYGIFSPIRDQWLGVDVETATIVVDEKRLKDVRPALDELGSASTDSQEVIAEEYAYERQIEEEIHAQESVNDDKEVQSVETQTQNEEVSQEIQEESKEHESNATNSHSTKPKVLECSSKGDKRYSAFYARVEVFGKEDSIENHYQLAKRFPEAPATWRDAKGKQPTHIEVKGMKLPPRFLSQWYTALWAKYLDSNPELVEYASQFDEFNDIFKGKAINCQADVVRKYIKEGRNAIADEIKELSDVLTGKIEVELEQTESKSSFSLTEEQGNLFNAEPHYALAHCISSDAKMGAGIAKQFTEKYPDMRNHLQMLPLAVGDVASYATKDGRLVFNLVTKRFYYEKPTYITLKESLIEMRKVAEDKGITYIAMPTIGSGLDKLDWEKVKEVIEQVFGSSDIQIKVVMYDGSTPDESEEKNYPELNTVIPNTVCFTGHRPKDLAGGYDPTSEPNRKMLWALRKLIERSINQGYDTFISGMALGIDQWAVKVLLALKKVNPQIKIIAAVPCEEQEAKWIPESKEEYKDLLSKVDEVHYLTRMTYNEYKKNTGHDCMTERNTWMINNSSQVIAVWNEKPNGGTADAVRKSVKQGKEIIHLHPDTLQAKVHKANAPTTV